MRKEINKVQFICEGTYLIDDQPFLCSSIMTIEDTPAMIEHRYRESGWGYIDEFQIRHLCSNSHLEKKHKGKK